MITNRRAIGRQEQEACIHTKCICAAAEADYVRRAVEAEQYWPLVLLAVRLNDVFYARVD